MYLSNLTSKEKTASPAMLCVTSYKQQLKKFSIFTNSVTAHNFRTQQQIFLILNEIGTCAYTNYPQKSSVISPENDQRNQSTLLEYCLSLV